MENSELFEIANNAASAFGWCIEERTKNVAYVLNNINKHVCTLRIYASGYYKFLHAGNPKSVIMSKSITRWKIAESVEDLLLNHYNVRKTSK